MNQVKHRDKLMQLKQKSGVVLDMDPDELPATTEEAEIFIDSNSKLDAEIAAQVATDMTLSWNKFEESTFRRCVNDLVTLGMAVVKRRNDPNYGIVEEYVDPKNYVHSVTEDPNMDDVVYGGHFTKISVGELLRRSNGAFDEEAIKKIMKVARPRGQENNNFYTGVNAPDRYDEHMVHIMDFEFMCMDKMHFEENTTRLGGVIHLLVLSDSAFHSQAISFGKVTIVSAWRDARQ